MVRLAEGVRSPKAVYRESCVAGVALTILWFPHQLQ